MVDNFEDLRAKVANIVERNAAENEASSHWNNQYKDGSGELGVLAPSLAQAQPPPAPGPEPEPGSGSRQQKQAAWGQTLAGAGGAARKAAGAMADGLNIQTSHNLQTQLNSAARAHWEDEKLSNPPAVSLESSSGGVGGHNIAAFSWDRGLQLAQVGQTCFHALEANLLLLETQSALWACLPPSFLSPFLPFSVFSFLPFFLSFFLSSFLPSFQYVFLSSFPSALLPQPNPNICMRFDC